MPENKRQLYRAEYFTEEDTEQTTSNDSPTSNESTTESMNLSPAEETWKKRYSDLRSYSTNLTDRIKELENQLKAANNKEIRLPSSKEELEAFARTYPDVFRNIRSIVLTELMQEREHIANETQSVKEDLERVKRERGIQKILSAHSDFEQINLSEDFHEWARTQPKRIQDWLFEDDDPDLCIRGLDLYKADRNIKKVTSQPKQRADARVNLRDTTQPDDQAGGKRVWKASEISKLNPSEFAKLEAEIDAANREGRIDLSA